jgi:magnesium transporter
MVTSIKRSKNKSTGLAPGTIVYIGEKREQKPVLELFEIGSKSVKNTLLKDISSFNPSKKDTIYWLNISGVQETSLIEDIGTMLNIHPLVLEDIANTHQRPKLEYFKKYIFIALKMLYYDYKNDIYSEHLSILLGANYVISFQEVDGDVFDSLRKRIISSTGRFQKRGIDYLCYTLIDSIVDNYFLILEGISEDLDFLEKTVVGNSSSNRIEQIHLLKRNLTIMRRSIWPLRDIISRMIRDEDNKFISKNTLPYLRDVYDHTVQIIDTVETSRETASGLIEIFLSKQSNRMNEIMGFLTLFATIFIPLTFLTGVYGMNFDWMPELNI